MINTATATLQQTIQLPGMIPAADTGVLAIAPDDSTLYAFGDNGTGGLCTINLTLYTQTNCVATIPSFLGGTRGIAISPDGSKLYLPVIFNSKYGNYSGLEEFDAQSLAITRQVVIGSNTTIFEESLVVSPGSNSVYTANINETTNPFTGSLTRVDLSTFTAGATQPLGFAAADVGVTPDVASVLVVGSNSGTQIFDGVMLAPKGTVPGGKEVSVVVASH